MVGTLIEMLSNTDPNVRVSALQCLNVVCNSYPREFILTDQKNVEVILPLLPGLLGDSKPPVAKEAVEFAAVLLKHCSRVDVVKQEIVADFFTKDEFLQPLVKLACSNPPPGTLLSALNNLMQSIGFFRPDNHRLSVGVSLNSCHFTCNLSTTPGLDFDLVYKYFSSCCRSCLNPYKP